MKSTTMSALAITAALALTLTAPLAASAHIGIDPIQAPPGSHTVLSIKVPNESETASTTKIEVSLPLATPFASVRYVPVTGWTAELVRETLPEPVTAGKSEITEAVTAVIWTAEPGSEIAAGQLQIFPLSVGPVPDTGLIVMPAVQTYSDGTVVSWSETKEDAEYPAPVLYVNEKPTGGPHGGKADAGHGEAEVSADAPADSGLTDVLARMLAIAGLVVGVVGLVLAVVARRPADR